MAAKNCQSSRSRSLQAAGMSIFVSKCSKYAYAIRIEFANFPETGLGFGSLCKW